MSCSVAFYRKVRSFCEQKVRSYFCEHIMSGEVNGSEWSMVRDKWHYSVCPFVRPLVCSLVCSFDCLSVCPLYTWSPAIISWTHSSYGFRNSELTLDDVQTWWAYHHTSLISRQMLIFDWGRVCCTIRVVLHSNCGTLDEICLMSFFWFDKIVLLSNIYQVSP